MPEDIQQVLPYVAAHRLQLAGEQVATSVEAVVKPFDEVAIP
jgi:hypothetical protein